MDGFKYNTMNDLYNWFKSSLPHTYPPRNKQKTASEVFRHLLKADPVQRALHPDKRFSESDIVRLKKALLRLHKGEPLEYVTGCTEFLGHPIRVQPGVLIPRPETEELVVWAMEQPTLTLQTAPLRMVDLGTGSGCIAIALALGVVNSEVWACDLDSLALEVAGQNARDNEVRIRFVQLDLLNDQDSQLQAGSFHTVVSNPPYVRNSEKKQMESNVLDHEPATALFVPDEHPLIYYKAIATQSMHWLKPGGGLYFEINEAMAEETVSLLKELGYSKVLPKTDINGKSRFVRGFKPLSRVMEKNPGQSATASFRASTKSSTSSSVV